MVALLMAAPAFAKSIVVGGSNLGLFGYPEHKCIEPRRPISNDDWAWNAFKRDIDGFKRCIEDYVDNADNDLKRVVNGREDAIDEWNAFVGRL